MKLILSKILIVVTCLQLLSPIKLMKAQSTVDRPMLDYQELKGLLLKHERTVTSILSRKRFKLVSSKKRPESTLYTYKKESSISQIRIRVRKSDALVSELAWNEVSETFGNFTHDAVDDGFVPMGGNSQYHNRFLNMVLFVYYDLSDDTTIPCVLRVVQ
jgi:hypothetical protein